MKELLEMPLWQMTGAEYLELHKLGHADIPCNPKPENKNERHYVYGLRGIRELFNVSHVTAQRLKDSILKPAVNQCGKKIIVDADYAMELFGNKKK